MSPPAFDSRQHPPRSVDLPYLPPLLRASGYASLSLSYLSLSLSLNSPSLSLSFSLLSHLISLSLSPSSG